MVAVNNGYEIQIDDLAQPDSHPVYRTAAIYGFAASNEIASKSAGEWNAFEFCKTEFTGNRSFEGYIGLQNHDSNSQASFRNIRKKKIS